MMKTITLFLACLLASQPAAAGWPDYLDVLKQPAPGGTASRAPAAAALTSDEAVAGLREALVQGTRFAVDQLGREGGFLDNAQVRIPMPQSLSWVEKSLRMAGQEQLADEFVASMNHAAEQAVPEAADIFVTAIQQMSLADANAILTGPDDAATQYFRTHTETALTARMHPIVAEATANAGVTAAYKNMLSSAGGLTGLLPTGATDLDGYVTDKALDGLFLMVASEERRIRANPLARSTELLKKVFGSVSP
jgi:hypothetical protein